MATVSLGYVASSKTSGRDFCALGSTGAPHGLSPLRPQDNKRKEIQLIEVAQRLLGNHLLKNDILSAARRLRENLGDLTPTFDKAKSQDICCWATALDAQVRRCEWRQDLQAKAEYARLRAATCGYAPQAIFWRRRSRAFAEGACRFSSF